MSEDSGCSQECESITLPEQLLGFFPLVMSRTTSANPYNSPSCLTAVMLRLDAFWLWALTALLNDYGALTTARFPGRRA